MITIQEIITNTENYFKLPNGSLVEYNRSKTTSKARHLAMYAARQAGYSLHEVGDMFHRDHTTIIYAVRRVNKQLTDECRPWWGRNQELKSLICKLHV